MRGPKSYAARHADRRSVPPINDGAVTQCHALFMHRVTNSANLTPTLLRSIKVAEIAVRVDHARVPQFFV